jgi:hypothetical protein
MVGCDMMSSSIILMIVMMIIPQVSSFKCVEDPMSVL